MGCGPYQVCLNDDPMLTLTYFMASSNLFPLDGNNLEKLIFQFLFKPKVSLPCLLDTNELRHEISHNVVCATSKASDQPVHMHSLIRAFACRLNIP